MRYWLSNGDGNTLGPYTLEELMRYQAEGRIGPSAMLCAEGSQSWVAVGAVIPGIAATGGTAIGSTSIYGGFWLRVAAVIIDAVITGVAGFMIGAVVGLVGGAAGLGTAELQIFSQVLGILIGWLYNAILESSPLQGTLGKLVLGLKVTDLNGNRIGFGRATGRYFAKILSGCALLIGYIMVAFTARKQGLHDMIAGTLVVRK